MHGGNLFIVILRDIYLLLPCSDHHYKIIWGYVGYADGYGLDGVPTQDSQESLDFLKKLDPVKFGEFNDSDEASTERLMALLEATKIDITDKNSGAVRLYNLDGKFKTR